MSERTSYKPGTPCWVDVATPDIDATVAFYKSLFNWYSSPAEPVEETDGYTMLLRGDKHVAAVGPTPSPDAPSTWVTHVSVLDADAATARAREAGGTVLAEPFDVVDAGRLAVLADPEGAVFSVWQPGKHAGAEVVNVPGALAWNELSAHDVDVVREFYSKVLGWSWHSAPELGDYELVIVDGEPVAGVQSANGNARGWLSYFAVEDCDATVRAGQSLGAKLELGPQDIPQGRFAVLRDTLGARFAIIALSDRT